MDILNTVLLPGWAAEVGAILLLKGSLLVAAAGVIAGGVRRGSAATRYAVWILAVVGLIALPGLPVLFSGTNLAWVTSPVHEGTGSGAAGVHGLVAAPSVAVTSVTAPDAADGLASRLLSPGALAGLALSIWLAGVLVLLARLVLAWVRIARITARAARRGVEARLARRGLVLARRQGVQRRIRVLFSAEMRVPVTWGIFRPVVLLPAESASWSAGHLDAVLLHELAHVRRWDYLTHLLCEAVRALYWPNPLCWLAHRRARMERERACDDAVLRYGTPSTDYARLLLSLARGLSAGPVARAAVAMARPSMLRARINGVLDGALDRRPTAPASVGLALAVLAALAGSVGTLRVWASPPRTEADWVRVVETAAPEMRLVAVDVLGSMGSDRAVGGLTRALTDADPRVRRSAVEALGRLADARVVPALVDVVTGSHGDLHQKRLATAALRAIDGRAAALAREHQLLEHGPATRSVRTAAAGPDPMVWRPLVEVLLEGADPAARSRAAAALVELGCEAAIPELVRATEDDAPEVRLAAAEALVQFDAWPARRALARLMDDEDPRVRAVAERGTDCGDAGPGVPSRSEVSR